MDYENNHRVAIARELTFAAGFPLRDRWGFAARHEDVLFVVDLLFREPDDEKAGAAIFLANMDHKIEIAEGNMAATEEYEQGIIAALRPLVDQRRQAEARSLR